MLTLIPPNKSKSKEIPYIWSVIEIDDLSTEEISKMELFWAYFQRYWLSKPTFINSWNIHHQGEEKTEDMKRTNNGLERYNKTLKALFDNETPSLLTFINTIKQESRDQVVTLDCIWNGLVNTSKKRKNEVFHDENDRNKISKFYHDFEP